LYISSSKRCSSTITRPCLHNQQRCRYALEYRNGLSAAAATEISLSQSCCTAPS
jgi:hypothetical protein